MSQHQPPTNKDQLIPRARTLTDADLKAIADYFHDIHVCRFHNIEPDDMTFLKDLLEVYKETRSEVVKWIVKGLLYGVTALIFMIAYFKLRGGQGFK